jgi:hypothetical protein
MLRSDSDDAMSPTSMTPADVRLEQEDICEKLYEKSIAPVLFVDPLAYNELNGKLVGEFKIPLAGARKYSSRICAMIARIIESENPGWAVIVTHAFTAKNEFALYVVLTEQ